MSTSWYAKIDCNFHSNRKAIKAGRLGREVYVFVLCVNAQRGGRGSIPRGDLEPWYVAQMLQMTEPEAEQGIADAVRAGLIEIDRDSVSISGWNDAWAKRPMTDAERKAKQRRKDPIPGECHETSRTESDSHDDRDMSRRKEGRKEGREGEDAPASSLPKTGIAIAESVWVRLSEIRMAVASELGLSNVLPFTPITPASSNQRGFRDLRERIREEGDGEAAEKIANRVLETLTAQARQKRSIEWLSEKAFSEGAWRTAREAVPKWRAPSQPQSTTRTVNINGTDYEVEVKP